MGKRWRVNVLFRSPGYPDTIVDSREFAFWIFAKLFAMQSDQWYNWNSTKGVIVDQSQ